MNKTTEALKLAEEALQHYRIKWAGEDTTPAHTRKALAAIRKALDEPTREPVAVVEVTYGREPECYVTGNIDHFPEGVFKLYAEPVEWVDLTDDEINELIQVWHESDDGLFGYASAIITAFKEKNA